MALNVDLTVDGTISHVCLSNTDLIIARKTSEEDEIHRIITLDEIIAVENNISSLVDVGDSDKALYSCVVHFITRCDHPKWITGCLTLTGTDDNIDEFQVFCTDLNLKFSNITALRPKRLLVLMNAIAGRRQAQNVYDTVMTPIFELAKITCDLVISQRPKHLIEVMTDYDCKDIDGIVIMGGDGTVSEIINVLIKKAQEGAGIDYNDPKAELKPYLKPIGVIPTGTGNAIAESLYGCQDVLTATLQVAKGKTRSISIMGSYCEDKLIGYCACAFGILSIVELLDIADRQLRWMRAARYLAVPFVYLTKRIHVAPVEVTVYSRGKQIREDNGKEEEFMVENKETFTQNSCMVMIFPWPVTDKSNNFCYNPAGIENKEEVFAYFYEPFGKFEMLRHILQIRNRANNIFENPKIKQVKGYALRIKFLGNGDNPAESDSKNLMVSIDGEVQDCSKADYYVKITTHVISAYCSR